LKKKNDNKVPEQRIHPIIPISILLTGGVIAKVTEEHASFGQIIDTVLTVSACVFLIFLITKIGGDKHDQHKH